MKIVLLVNVLIFISCSVKAQNKSDQYEDSLITNSLKKNYEKDNPNLKYNYDEKTQTHNYSWNWDIDGDGQLDSVFFIGNGGAHLYYHLKVILSLDKVVRNYNFILIDFPKLGSVNSLKGKGDEKLLLPQFVVADFNHDGRQDIYINMNIKANPIPTFWKRKGVTSNRLLLSSNGKHITIRNFARVQ